MASGTNNPTPDDFAREGMDDIASITFGWPFVLGLTAGIVASAIAEWDVTYPALIGGFGMGVFAVFVVARKRGATVGQAVGAAILGAPYLYFMKRRAWRKSPQEPAETG